MKLSIFLLYEFSFKEVAVLLFSLSISFGISACNFLSNRWLDLLANIGTFL